MLRHKHERPARLVKAIHAAFEPDCPFHVGAYLGYLDPTAKKVRENEELCFDKATALLKKKTKKESNFKTAVLLLTHGIMHRTWWGDQPLPERYRRALEKALKRLKLGPNEERADLYLECMISLGRTREIPRDECVRMLNRLPPGDSIGREHLRMLLKHVSDKDAMVSDLALLDRCVGAMTFPSSTMFEHRAEEVLPGHCIEALRRHVVEEVLNIRSYSPIPEMDYVRIKHCKGAYTKVHCDYNNLVHVRKKVSEEDAKRVRVVWVALCDVEEGMSMLRFVNREKGGRTVKKGHVFVFDLFEEHFATEQRLDGRPRISVDFRILLN